MEPPVDILIDGLPATPADLAHQALVNYGAYTSFRVEAGAVRGLDLHLARLEQAAVELFGDRPGEGVRGRIVGPDRTGGPRLSRQRGPHQPFPAPVHAPVGE